MGNEQCFVSVSVFYGDDWWLENKKVLNDGWEWEFRNVVDGDTYLQVSCDGMQFRKADCFVRGPRIVILRAIPKRLYFKAECKIREARDGDWFWSCREKKWKQYHGSKSTHRFLCATRHEEVDIDALTQPSK